MRVQRAWIAILFTVTSVGYPAKAFATQPTSYRTERQRAERPEAFFTGTVVRVYAPRLFSIRRSDDKEGAGRELLVLAPREFSTVEDAKVAVSGTMRRFDARDLRQVRGWSELDPGLRARFAGQPVLVASAVMSTLPETGEPEEPAEQKEPGGPEIRPPHERAPSRAPLVLRASTLVDFVEAFAGQQVRVQNARVVGLLSPGVFLVEPATRYLKAMGQRDRLAVFIDRAQLRVPPEVLVGTIIGIEGVARTMLSMQVSGDAQWPSRLSRDEMERLEVRAAILAISVHTAEGTELTDRQVARAKH